MGFPKGHELRSRWFALKGHTLQFRFYPQGNNKASPGQCSLYLACEREGFLGCMLSINGTERSLTHEFENGGDRGFCNMANMTTHDAEVSVVVWDPPEVVVEDGKGVWHIPQELQVTFPKGHYLK